jgi:mannitol/fructose-specific phosphotransferase system IIA component (Ntr-type)
MPFVERLRAELVCVAPPWQTFTETVDGLVGALVAAGGVPEGARAAAVAAIAAREAEAPTALLDIRAGVPHARLAGLDDSAVALALSSAGLYEAVPTVRIQIVALVLSPPQATAHHLEILAGISTTLRSAELRAALLRARGGAEALAALRRHAG